MRCKVLVIGERIHDPKQLGREGWWRDRYCSSGIPRIRHVLGMPAMTEGSTRKRLERMLGFAPDTKVVNLLWPDSKPGTWDETEAEVSARSLMSYLAENEKRHRHEWTGLALLGKRVSRAFSIPSFVEFGERLTIGPSGWEIHEEGPVLLLPHPSGRSLSLNSESERARFREIVSRFLKDHSDG